MKIKIVATPAGQAPLWVREQWVGLVLPVDEKELFPVPQTGVLGGIPSPENLGGYPVETTEAIRLLGEKSQEAAAWWEALPTIGLMDHLVFGRKFCELVP